MNIEKIFNDIPKLENIKMDIILFESNYPVLFTCKRLNDVFLFCCCLVDSNKIKWIGTKTDYNILIQLLQDEITIRDAFMGVTDKMLVIEYKGVSPELIEMDKTQVPDCLLPTAGEFIEAEEGEYLEEIRIFLERNKTVEYKIKKCNKVFVPIVSAVSRILLPEEFFVPDRNNRNDMYDFRNSSTYSLVYA